jgi:hypothetical protein
LNVPIPSKLEVLNEASDEDDAEYY